MGIYISGVKGLPEQVQENKEKIANIEEDIADIDWDAIHNLENQVAENTQDINNMEGTIGTQNIAITNLGGRVDDLETKTSEITKSATATNISGTTTLYNVVVGANLATQGDIEVNRSIVMSYDEGSKMELDINSTTYYGFNNDEQAEIHSVGDVYKFTSTGITLNGNPIGTKLYEHNINYNETNNLYWCLTIITDSATPLTFNEVISYLYNKGFRARESAKVCSGQYKAGSTIGATVNGIFADSTTKYGICYTTPSTINILNLLDDYSTAFTDNVIALS